MPELIKTAEIIGDVLKAAKHVGEYVMEQVHGGGWSRLPGDPNKASITVYEGEEHIIRGEE